MSKLLKDPIEQKLDAADALFSKGYAAFAKQREFKGVGYQLKDA